MVAALAQVLARDPDPDRRVRAARLLGEARAPRAVAALAEALEDPERLENYSDAPLIKGRRRTTRYERPAVL